jgi:mono/diheme cytochrome c family protein
MRAFRLGLSTALFLSLCVAATAACQSADDSVDGAGDELNQAPPQPAISQIVSGGKVIWQAGQGKPTVTPGQELTLKGADFGDGPDTQLSKILVGNSRALERDLPLYKGEAHLANGILGGDVYEETPDLVDAWKKDITKWTDTEITFRIPTTVQAGDVAIVVQVQKYKDTVKGTSNDAVRIKDPLSDFLNTADKQKVASVTVGVPGPASASPPLLVTMNNPDFEASRARGEAMFWAWDFNLGVAQKLAKVGWDDIFGGSAVDPVTGKAVSPTDFGAIFIDGTVGVPDVARQPHAFSPYPITNPLETLISSSLKEGTTTPLQWVGYVRADGKDPLLPGLVAQGQWIGFNCASCHGQRIDYEAAPGQRVAKVFAGLPNTKWNAKWTTYSQETRGLKNLESPLGGGLPLPVDKTQLMHALPDGTAESSLLTAENAGQFANDHFYSPVAIPIITKHTPVRRALSRGELIAGFEGSYLHPQAPEGTMGPVHVSQLKDLTAYMTTLDRDHDTLVSVGMHEWLKHKNKLGEIGNSGQGQFVQMGMEKALATFPDLASKVNHGRDIFQRDCASCHASNFGTNTDETIFAFTDVGSYFSPSLWNREGQGIRTAMIRDLYWTQSRGMLHDGHVRSSDEEHLDSVELLLNPSRCDEGSSLYKQMYTINAQSFRIPKGTVDQERATRQQAYFVDWPNAVTSDENKYLYWDYQQLRHSFGPKELGTAKKDLPAMPHPWCAKSTSDVDDLLHYLFTL